MKIADKYSYRHARSILEAEYPSELLDVEVILEGVDFVKQQKIAVLKTKDIVLLFGGGVIF